MLLSHVTVADPDSSDSNRLYPNNSIPTKFLHTVPKEVFTLIFESVVCCGCEAWLLRREEQRNGLFKKVS